MCKDCRDSWKQNGKGWRFQRLYLMAEGYRGILLPHATSLIVALREGYGSTACSCQASQKQHRQLRDRLIIHL